MMGFTSYLGNNYSTIDVAPNQPDLFVVQKFLAERIPEKKIRIVLHRSVRLGTSHYRILFSPVLSSETLSISLKTMDILDHET